MVEQKPRLAEKAVAEAQTRQVNAAQLERGNRSLDEWREALSSLTREEDYRGQPLPHSLLWETLEDPGASPVQRLGAAIALHVAGASSPRALRIARQEPHVELSHALTQALEGSLDDELAEELTRPVSACR